MNIFTVYSLTVVFLFPDIILKLPHWPGDFLKNPPVAFFKAEIIFQQVAQAEGAIGLQLERIQKNWGKMEWNLVPLIGGRLVGQHVFREPETIIDWGFALLSSLSLKSFRRTAETAFQANFCPCVFSEASWEAILPSKKK